MIPNVWSCEINADSVNGQGDRITTFVLTYPRFIHAELMTHRVFARNAASSRAIPVLKVVEAIENNPAAPIHWGANQPGMQAFSEVSAEVKGEAAKVWMEAAADAIRHARRLEALGLHKQIVNRVTEPYAWITTVLTGTEFNNFFHQRFDKHADPNFIALARQMAIKHELNRPSRLRDDQSHLPFTKEGDIYDVQKWIMNGGGSKWADRPDDPESSGVNYWMKRVSTARCGRVSYTNHDGSRSIADDVVMFKERLLTPGHWSPFEHIAKPIRGKSGCFQGWKPFRKEFTSENRIGEFSSFLAEQALEEAGWNIQLLQAPFDRIHVTTPRGEGDAG